MILDDLGLDTEATRRAIRLPAPLTLSFLPYGRDTPALAREARAAGHEVFVHLPMEPRGGEDPGPMALLFGLPREELRRRLLWAIGRVPGAVGANNHMGSRLTADARAMAEVMSELARLSLTFVDSMTTPASLAGAIARANGVPAIARDLFLDHDPAPASIRARLAEAERIARTFGTAVAIGHPRATTLAALAEWLPSLAARGVGIAPATTVVELRGCRGPGRGCVLRADRDPDAGEPARLPLLGAPGPVVGARLDQ
ncbi:MAG: divergent polysaccharide deacetylase family protein [Geminicoccaceae bacterium]|nr:divergent polysaccharide deacetylase family protein [Geminicoccaceae bacterium]MDW8342853.1 divergent polysaccharide deacetylase family protein [Geminicoccaceae bacterium]